MLDILLHPSPNFNKRRPTVLCPTPTLDMLVLHYTGMRTGEEAINRMCDPNSEVSAHYTILEDGIILQLVPDDKRAWHAGRGFWRGETDINSRSLGIEIVNPGHEFGYHPFPHLQMQAVYALCLELVATYKIPPAHIIAHSDLAPDRKQDPGELFDWQGLAKKGIGLPPPKNRTHSLSGETAVNTQIDPLINPSVAIEYLRQIGYGIAPYDAVTSDFTQVLTAFQRRFAPSLLGKNLCCTQMHLLSHYASLS